MMKLESPQQSKCVRCGRRLTSPARCTYLDEEFACYLWVCPKCRCEFESSICLYQHIEALPENAETFPLGLVVA